MEKERKKVTETWSLGFTEDDDEHDSIPDPNYSNWLLTTQHGNLY